MFLLQVVPWKSGGRIEKLLHVFCVCDVHNSRTEEGTHYLKFYVGGYIHYEAPELHGSSSYVSKEEDGLFKKYLFLLLSDRLFMTPCD